MLNGGKFSSSLRNLLWAEAAQTATVLQNNLVSQKGVMSPYHQFFGREELVYWIQIKDLVKFSLLPTVLLL